MQINGLKVNLPDITPYRAWDAADEYILSSTIEEPALIINDSYGGLSSYLKESVCYTNSRVSQKHIETSLRLNNSQTRVFTYLEEVPKLEYKTIIIKLPKNLDELEYYITTIGRMFPGIPLIAGGMIKYMPISMVRLVEKYYRDVTTSKGVKKARLIYGTSALENSPPDYPFSYSVENLGAIFSYPGVFSAKSLDIGTRFLLPHIPNNIDGNIIDLACGSGVLGLRAAKNSPEAEVYLTYESSLAIKSAKYTFKESGVKGHFLVGDGLEYFKDNFGDLIILNPPFHLGTKVLTDIAKSMFKECSRVLKPGGKLLIVANSHLGYEKELKAIFGRVKVVDRNKKFTIYSN